MKKYMGISFRIHPTKYAQRCEMYVSWQDFSPLRDDHDMKPHVHLDFKWGLCSLKPPEAISLITVPVRLLESELTMKRPFPMSPFPMSFHWQTSGVSVERVTGCRIVRRLLRSLARC